MRAGFTLLVGISALTMQPAYATCVGSSAFQSCYDNNGNSYTVQRYGNSTYMNGNNSRTGSTWSQNSQRVGNSTYTQGNTNGRSWNMTQTPYGTYGTNSSGQSFSYPSTPSYGGSSSSTNSPNYGEWPE